MLKIHTIPVGMLQTNCYLVCREGASSCLVIDPGDSARKIQKKLDAEGLSIDSTLADDIFFTVVFFESLCCITIHIFCLLMR